MATSLARSRMVVRVEGTVQGVGFRPFVYRLAAELGLAGSVLNDARGVAIDIEGEGAALARFLERLVDERPPLARVERVVQEHAPARGVSGFEIVASRGGVPEAPVSADSATCDDCLHELFDPHDRRYRYPFINCTNCGPRFTIVRGVPYDRPLTTMADFVMCKRCRSEYEDPRDRRFHAQPNACPECGPRVRLAGEAAGDPLEAAAAALAGGAIVAVKGLGGFHLACRADDERAVATLRSRKHREEKPFALMAREVDAARSLVELSAEAEALLASGERPIVLAPRAAGAPVAEAVAPRSAELGVMLPYSPLHHLLLADARVPLVMTSGNVSDEPIAYRDADAIERLGEIADLLLVHDRPIETRTDDSVARIAGGRPRLLRRSRGYVPRSLPLPAGGPDLLACGAELKSTFCVAKGGRAWVSHHVGDLRNWETLSSFCTGVEHFERLFAVSPRRVAHDMHPDYLSTKYALERAGVEHVAVQHHHAHLAACLAEHRVFEPAVGAIYDGTGYGLDGSVWGGELLAGGLDGFMRVGHLWPVRLPGGERAVREPWRMACAWLSAALDSEEPPLPALLRGSVDESSWRSVARLASAGLASPLTTSVGRLFDAVAALCGVQACVNYEGQAAIELEAVASRSGDRGAYPLPVSDALVLDARPTIEAIAKDLSRGEPPSLVSARFHDALAAATAEACMRACEAGALDTVVLSGGVFQNRRLLEGTVSLLRGRGVRTLVPALLPAGDGGIAFGQAAVASV